MALQLAYIKQRLHCGMGYFVQNQLVNYNVRALFREFESLNTISSQPFRDLIFYPWFSFCYQFFFH